MQRSLLCMHAHRQSVTCCLLAYAQALTSNSSWVNAKMFVGCLASWDEFQITGLEPFHCEFGCQAHGCFGDDVRGVHQAEHSQVAGQAAGQTFEGNVVMKHPIKYATAVLMLLRHTQMHCGKLALHVAVYGNPTMDS